MDKNLEVPATSTPRLKGTGQRKIHKGIRFKDHSQYCMDTTNPAELVKSIPKEIDILSIKVRIGSNYFGCRYTEVPTELALLGVHRMAVPRKPYNTIVVLSNITRKDIINKLQQICKISGYEYPKDCAVMTMLIEKDGVRAYFKGTRKEIRPNESDQRKKLSVLGMESTNDEENINGLLSALGAKKYSCKIDTIPVRTIVCSSIE